MCTHARKHACRRDATHGRTHGSGRCKASHPSLAPPMQIMHDAQSLLPGGVNSPVRAFRSVGGGPIVFDRVKGSKVG